MTDRWFEDEFEGLVFFSPLRAPFLERCSGTSVLVHLRSAGLGCRVVVSLLAARGLSGPFDLSSSAVCAFLSLSASLVSSRSLLWVVAPPLTSTSSPVLCRCPGDGVCFGTVFVPFAFL